MQDSILKGREIRDKFKGRIQIINKKRLKAQQEKQKELERIERAQDETLPFSQLNIN